MSKESHLHSQKWIAMNQYLKISTECKQKLAELNPRTCRNEEKKRPFELSIDASLKEKKKVPLIVLNTCTQIRLERGSTRFRDNPARL